MRLLQELVHGRQTRGHPLRQSASHYSLVVTHCLQDQTDVTNGSPLDGNLRNIRVVKKGV